MSSLKNDLNEKQYWRSLSELADTEEFQSYVSKEFADVQVGEEGSVSRRRFMQLMGASVTLAGTPGCWWEGHGFWKEEKILPHVRRPQGWAPGTTKQYATAMEMDGVAQLLRIDSADGRPIKVEGNPEDSAGRGASNAYAQGSVLGLYDPDRSKKPAQKVKGAFRDITLDQVDKAVATATADLANGVGMAVLAEPSSSPSFARLKAEFMAKYPEATWVTYSPIHRENEIAGSEKAFGQRARAQYDFTKAKVFLAIDSDVLSTHPNGLQHAADWASQRNPESGSMNRTYVIESTFSGTGATADHRYPVRPSQVKAYLVKLEDEVRRISGQPRLTGEFTSGAIIDDAKWVTAIAKDLAANAGASLVTVGAGQSPDVHALAHRLNALLGNVGKTINYTTEPSESNGVAGLRGLTEKMAKGEVAFLAMLGGNPVYDAPVDFKFADALAKVSFSMHLSLYRDETSLASTLHVPASHYLESWGDSRRWDGTVAVVQPLIRPLYASRTKSEALAAITTGKTGDDKARLGTTIDEAFKPTQPTEADAEVPAEAVAEVTDEAAAPATATTDDPELKALKLLNGNERRWRKIVHRGLIDGTAYPVIDTTVQPFSVSNWDKTTVKASSNLANGEFEVVFFEDGKVHDGRFANNGWLQETPNGITKLTWDNAALVSPKTARKLGLVEEDVVTIKTGDQSIEAAVSVLPGQPTGTVGLAFGYGRTESGVVGGSKSQGIASPGVSVYNLRTADGQWHRPGVTIEKTGRSYTLAGVQDHHAIDKTGMEERERRAVTFIREMDLDTYKKNPATANEKYDTFPKHKLLSLFDQHKYEGHKWGMSIDLTSCTGCNSCVVACTAENNVPVVGKDQVKKGREMHWLRIDRYFVGDEESPEMLSQPLGCVQCQNAPCEQVCPVAATVHSAEGLNDMVYNRCIGTRYCANNCPFKVRRFNYHNYHEDLKDSKNKVKTMVFNPEVSVRVRGVMEKCTYCVQRIKEAKLVALNEKRTLRDGDIQTACSQACPSNAIVFGDLNDKNSRVAKLQTLARSYAMLFELNIRPRTQYLAKIRNPNPELKV